MEMGQKRGLDETVCESFYMVLGILEALVLSWDLCPACCKL